MASLVFLYGIFSSFAVNPGHTSGVPAVSGYSATDPARFEISFHRGKLELDGHTVSSSHERTLLHAAEQSFSALETSTTFRPLGVAPDQWSTTTVSLLKAVSTTQSSSALLTDGILRIRGVAADNWHGRFNDLRRELPGSIDLDVDILVPDSKANAMDLCVRAFAARIQGPVNFEESGTALRSSAYLELDRVVALADACRDSTVSITGHTDSSGDEASNLMLSLARAKTVAEYFAERGLARERLIVAGAGSSLPIADNGKRFGRSLNRRIDISLQRPAGEEEI